MIALVWEKKFFSAVAILSCISFILPLNSAFADHHHDKDKHEHHHKGDKGDRGEKGECGEKGHHGEKGERGEKGHHGEKGERGERGHQGEKGERGERGETGHAGSAGPMGPMGPTGPAFVFPKDIGKTLEFNYSLAVTLGELGSVGIPFVIKPDGTVMEGIPQPIVIGLNSFPSTLITDPEFGHYAVGIQLNNGLTAVGANLILSVVDFRTSNNNTIIYNGPVVNGLAQFQTHTISSYAYGTTNVP